MRTILGGLWGKAPVCIVLAIGALLVGACSGAGSEGAGSDAGNGADTTMSGGAQCTTNAECTSKVPPTTPANCAEGTCDTLQGTCVFSAKDEDGDGHSAADCKSTNGVAIVTGDDCNDHDPNLYPGHPESCMTLPDGGAPGDGYCAPGTIRCNSDGTQTGCENTKVCANSACVNETCVGSCAPGNARCEGNGVETCTSEGVYGGPKDCGTKTCISKGQTASCEGKCASGSKECSGNQPELCSDTGVWEKSGAVCSGSAPVCDTNTNVDPSAGTCVVCVPNAVGCTGKQPEVCNTSGTALIDQSPCANACFNGACADCDPGTKGCNSSGQPQTCDSSGTWNAGSCPSGQVCSGTDPSCVSGCSIGGSFYASGAVNASDACQTCQPDKSTSAWSGLADGTMCGNGQVCSGGLCGTQCDVGGAIYGSGVANPANACQSCQPGTSTTAWTDAIDGASCGTGKVCSAVVCEAGCFIAGTVYVSGATNPSNTCQSCQPGVSTTAWANVANGQSCGPGAVCSAGTCGSDCYIGGTIYGSGVVNPGNACQTCQPGASTTAWSANSLVNGTSCGTGEVCNAGSCESGCFIGGTIYGSGVANPSDSCQSCVPTTSTTGWTTTAASDGTGCGAGEVCSAGSCEPGCFIGGVVYASGAVNPGNGCQGCMPGTSTTGWTNADGASCNGSGTCSTGSCIMPASCQTSGAGRTNCGAGGSGSGSESCCTSLEVVGGTYYRTYANSGTGPTGEGDAATVSGFRLDKYLVTVGRFRQFVAAWNGGAGYLPSAGSGKHTHLHGGSGLSNNGSGGDYEAGWDATDWNNTADVDPTNTNLACGAPYATWTNTVGSQENLPINCVNWWESYAFCIWDGGFLPSEAEWEYAASGGGGASGQREYPWGSTAPGTANQYAIYNNDYTANPTHIAPVGYASLGAGYWGQLDLAGEVYEWNVDWEAAYAACTDCAYLTTSSYRVVRGGGFGGTTAALLPPTRLYDTPALRGSNFGFRCARTP